MNESTALVVAAVIGVMMLAGALWLSPSDATVRANVPRTVEISDDQRAELRAQRRAHAPSHVERTLAEHNRQRAADALRRQDTDGAGE